MSIWSLNSGSISEDRGGSQSLFSLQSDGDGVFNGSTNDLITDPAISKLQRVLLRIVESIPFNVIISTVILINFITIGLEVAPNMALTSGYYLTLIYNMVLGIYTFEVIVRMGAWRKAFFNSNWHKFDLIMVIFGWFTIIAPVTIISMTTTTLNILRILMALRLIRIMRMLRNVPAVVSLQTILQTLILSVPAMATILMLTLVILYFYTVMCVYMFNSIDPGNFGTLYTSARAFLQVASLDVWSSIYFQSKYSAPALFPVLVSYIIVQTFVLFNLLTAVIVDNLAMLRKKSNHAARKKTVGKTKKAQAAKIKRQRTKVQTNIKEFGLFEYYSQDLPLSTQDCMSSYFQSLAALEHNLHQHNRHQKMIDSLVLLLKERKS